MPFKLQIFVSILRNFDVEIILEKFKFGKIMFLPAWLFFLTFSPLSAGRKKPAIVSMESIVQGMMMLNV